MLYTLETRIQMVVLMPKFESPIRFIRDLQRQKATEIPERHTITRIYQNSSRLILLKILKLLEDQPQ